VKFTGERVVPTDMHQNIDTYQQHLARYVWALAFIKHKLVLDAACGTGYGSNLLATIARKVVGWDVETRAIDYCRLHYPNVVFDVVDLTKLDRMGVSFDTVITFETLEHLEKPEEFLAWTKEHSKQCIGSLPIQCPTPYHKHVYSSGDIIKLVKKFWPEAGFYVQDDLTIEYIGHSHIPENLPNGMILFNGYAK